MMRIEENQKSLIAHRLALEIRNVERVAAQQHAQRAHERRGPLLFAHLVSTRIEPHHILDLRTTDATALEKFRPAKNRVSITQSDQFPGELQKLVLVFRAFPLEPTQLIILAIGVVVSILRSAELISAT